MHGFSLHVTYTSFCDLVSIFLPNDAEVSEFTIESHVIDNTGWLLIVESQASTWAASQPYVCMYI